MKKLKKLALSLLLGAMTVISPVITSNNVFSSIAVAQDQSITVQGQAAIDGNKAAAQKKALADAFRNAVEKGLGVWVKSQTEVKDFETKKDEILTRSEGYVTEHEILNETESDGIYTVTIKAQVAVDKIGADLKKLVGRLKTQMGNPAIAFVLTTWENKGIKTTVNLNQNTDHSLSTQASEGVQAVNSIDTPEGSYVGATSTNPNMAVKTSSKVSREVSIQKIDESVWKKCADATIVDSFKQEFLEKGFDLKATDEAMEIANSVSLAQTSIDISDRAKVRVLAEKEGANFIARGEVQVIDSRMNENTGSYVVTSKVGVEIIDVNSGDIVASYSNTASASSSSQENARAQSIKKVAILGAKTMASQTIDKWQDRSNNGMKFTIEVRNVKSARGQKMPFLKALKAIAQITSQTSPKENTLLLDVMYKGQKSELGEALLEQIGKEKGFSEKEFEGPDDDAGKIIFKFTQK
ncbi:MAG: flagellar assembly protein T N-terminal domain-containing protein [Candidatus Sericytochromatia bacterium]|nr:flagellar assembly protein T N-terminal domain-containing protein [Candidatus Sericytochromatia bacterium]